MIKIKKLNKKELLMWFDEFTGYTANFVKECGFSGQDNMGEMACCQVKELIENMNKINRRL